jgi:hypothetical protein
MKAQPRIVCQLPPTEAQKKWFKKLGIEWVPPTSSFNSKVITGSYLRYIK